MTCRLFDEKLLRPCGKRCKNFKQILLEMVDPDQQRLLASILQKLYFGIVGELGQKKAVLITQSPDIVSNDSLIILCVLLEGYDNLEFIQLVKQFKDFIPGFGYNSFVLGRIKLLIRCYNKCFCDQCVYGQLYRSWFSISEYQYRVFIYSDFYITLYQFPVRYKPGISLVQQAIDAASPYFDCCRVNYSRSHAPWLGDGAEPKSSVCAFAPKRNLSHSIITQNWNRTGMELPNSRLLLKRISIDYIEVHTEDGYLLRIRNYPFHIKRYITEKGLLFIYNFGGNDCIIVTYNADYGNENVYHPPYY